MLQPDGIGAITAELEARVKSPEGKLDIAKSGVKVAQTILRYSVQGFIGQNIRHLWEKLRDLQGAVVGLKEEVKNFTEATGKDVSSEITALIADAEADVNRYREEIPKLPERSRRLMNMVFTI